MLADGKEIKAGEDIPGLGVIQPDVEGHDIITDNLIELNKDTVDKLAEMGSDASFAPAPFAGRVTMPRAAAPAVRRWKGTGHARTQGLRCAEGRLEGIRGVKALDHVDFEVLEGEVHCLAGENGCGNRRLSRS